MNNDYFNHHRIWQGASQLQCDSAPATQAKAEALVDAIADDHMHTRIVELLTIVVALVTLGVTLVCWIA